MSSSRLQDVLIHLQNAEASLKDAAAIIDRAGGYVEVVLQETPETHQTHNDPVILQIKTIFGQWTADLKDEMRRVSTSKDQVKALLKTIEKDSSGK